MNPTTLDALADFPRQLEAHFAAVPDGYARWTPDD
ncbi:DinB family protein, partial [Burkholderia sola]|nr:DinB family protein [Burkholderia sola]